VQHDHQVAGQDDGEHGRPAGSAFSHLGNVLPLRQAPFVVIPAGAPGHGRSVTSSERESAPVRKALLIQVLTEPPNFTRAAVALRAWTTRTRSESSWPPAGPGSAPSKRACRPAAGPGGFPGCAGGRGRRAARS